MGANIQVLIIVGTIIYFATISYAFNIGKGTATFYKRPYEPYACNVKHDFEGNFIAAASDKIWENSGACGEHYVVVKCIGVTNRAPPPCKDGIVTVKIVDYCRGPRCGTITLSEDAGRIKIEYFTLGS
ncbi:EG45-like domain containing protein isoform X1 [Alnus glutinosa]|uniref:EG45-like domain containing protein isoform X1 n=1 Tax=Alnus glutinosa TaxID=3517 RepID=UPI002D78257C|nr:EG45-like domain containing protein isoform X1 [Alnus glutinosa]